MIRYRSIKKFQAALGFVLITAVVASGPALAQKKDKTPAEKSPLQKAQAAYDQGNYEKVEQILADVLRQPAPSRKALKLGMEAAIRTGRIMSASQRATRIMNTDKYENPGEIYRTAVIAYLAGKTKQAMSRFQLYSRKAKGKSAKMKIALDYLLAHGLYPEAFKKFLSLYGPDPRRWKQGRRLAEGLLDAEQPLKTLELCDVLFKYYGEEPFYAGALAEWLKNNRKKFTGPRTGKMAESLISKCQERSKEGAAKPGIVAEAQKSVAAGKLKPAQLKKLFKGLDPVEKIRGVNAVFKAGEKFSNTTRAYLLLNVLKPSLNKLSTSNLYDISIHASVVDNMEKLVNTSMEKKVQQAAMKFRKELAPILLANARLEGNLVKHASYFREALLKMFENKEWGKLYSGIHRYSEVLAKAKKWKPTYRQHVQPVLVKFNKNDAYECAFLFTVLLKRNVENDKKAAQEKLAEIRTQISSRVPGVLPVDRNDPTYELHKAAQALRYGNKGKAWQLTKPRLNLLKKKWRDIDPYYAAWATEQMRRQQMKEEAMELCQTALLKEQKLPAGAAAWFLLIKGDLYRDDKNFQAARLEYKSLKNNDRYKNTKAGRKAQFRLVNLLIRLNNYGEAREQLEYIVNTGDIREQADAFYYFAKMKYQQEKYEEANKFLKKVFNRVHGHVKGRLLEGRLRLHLPRGLTSTRVAIGKVNLRKKAMPGRPLHLQLQDRNLAVARGSKSIPIVVEAIHNGDMERLKLLPGAEEEAVYSADIETELADAEKGDGTLQVAGHDKVIYQITPEFQDAHQLNYPAKAVQMVAAGSVTVSAAQILTEEEREKLEEEEGDEDKRFKRRSGDTVRPGSPFYAQVTDLDRDMTDQEDFVTVTARTSSGDIVKGKKLTEIGRHKGIFRGKFNTDMPLPKVFTSEETEESHPNAIINHTKQRIWSSLPNAEKPKWIELDAMTSHEIKRTALLMPDPGQIKKMKLLGSLTGGEDEEKELVARYPQKKKSEIKGGIKVQAARGQVESSDPDSVREAINDTDNPYKTRLSIPVFKRTEVTKKAATYGIRMAGKFYQPEGREMMFKFLQPVPEGGKPESAFLIVDGEIVLGGTVRDKTLRRTGSIYLQKGVHSMEVLAATHNKGSKIVVGYKQKNGKFNPLPPERFSPREHEELYSALRPVGRMKQTEKGFLVSMTEPRRFRKLRWVFQDYKGASVKVREMVVVNTDDEQVIPTDQDFSDGKKNDIVEVAPGDTIRVSYHDQYRLDSREPTLSASLKSSFTNGEIEMSYEVVSQSDGQKTSEYFRAKRVRLGDQLSIRVSDKDLDVTPKPDKVDIEVATSGGERMTVSALEQGQARGDDEDVVHSGVFTQILKFGKKTVPEENKIKLQPGDTVRVSYLDKQNTEPGVPVRRTYEVEKAPDTDPRLTVFRTRVRMVPETSEQAERKLERLREKPTIPERVKLYKKQIIAEAPEQKPPRVKEPVDQEDVEGDDTGKSDEKTGKTDRVKPEETPNLSVEAPVVMQVHHPEVALHEGSTFDIYAVAGSDWKQTQKARAKSGREGVASEGKEAGPQPRVIRVPLQIGTAGQGAEGVEVTGAPDVGDDALEAGYFAGAVKLQLGEPGSEPSFGIATEGEGDLLGGGSRSGQRERSGEDTLVVRGTDTVRLYLGSEKDKMARHLGTYNLRSDGRLRLMDQSFTVRKDEIHLSQKFYLRVTDPDQDMTDKLDTVQVGVLSECGDRTLLTLDETLPHSGVFTTDLKPHFRGVTEEGKAAPIDKSDGKLAVDFGDRITMAYIDDTIRGKEGALSGPEELQGAAKFTYMKRRELARQAQGQQQDRGPSAAGEAGEVARPDDVETPEGAPAQQGAVQTRVSAVSAPFKVHRVEGNIFKGADGSIDAFTKRFKDDEVAVKTRFLMAEALFEMAKDHRKIDKKEKALAEIKRGKRILEQAIHDFPNTSMQARADYLLANLSQQLKEFETAVTRYSSVISNYPDSKYAPKAQFKKAMCLEKMDEYDKAVEEYVRLTYIYPNNKLVADATVRLANYYYEKGKYIIAGDVFRKFQDNNAEHRLAAKALFLAGQSYLKYQTAKEKEAAKKNDNWQGDYSRAIEVFEELVETYQDKPKLRAEGMYWLGDANYRQGNYAAAYQVFKRLTWDYPASKWAKIARGRLTEKVLAKQAESQ